MALLLFLFNIPYFETSTTDLKVSTGKSLVIATCKKKKGKFMSGIVMHNFSCRKCSFALVCTLQGSAASLRALPKPALPSDHLTECLAG